MTNDIMVSVCVIAYNHERFIRQCLESIVNQKTTFAFEVVIHDDASPDHTPDIIREFETRYPDKIKVIYQTVNQHNLGVKITTTHVLPLVRGKYFAYCEGDDYFTDEYKLQKQVDYLENHPDICALSIGTRPDCLGDEVVKLLSKLNKIKPI